MEASRFKGKSINFSQFETIQPLLSSPIAAPTPIQEPYLFPQPRHTRIFDFRIDSRFTLRHLGHHQYTGLTLLPLFIQSTNLIEEIGIPSPISRFRHSVKSIESRIENSTEFRPASNA